MRHATGHCAGDRLDGTADHTVGRRSERHADVSARDEARRQQSGWVVADGSNAQAVADPDGDLPNVLGLAPVACAPVADLDLMPGSERAQRIPDRLDPSRRRHLHQEQERAGLTDAPEFGTRQRILEQDERQGLPRRGMLAGLPTRRRLGRRLIVRELEEVGGVGLGGFVVRHGWPHGRPARRRGRAGQTLRMVVSEWCKARHGWDAAERTLDRQTCRARRF